MMYEALVAGILVFLVGLLWGYRQGWRRRGREQLSACLILEKKKSIFSRLAPLKRFFLLVAPMA